MIHTSRITCARALRFAAAFLVVLSASSAAQTRQAGASLRSALQARAGSAYTLGDVIIVPNDSAVIEFEDPTYTGASRAAGTWMFGPPVPAIEQDSCPPPKILGRKIARVLWQQGGKDAHLEKVTVLVHGSSGLDRLSYTAFHYEPSQLDGLWAGDPASMPAKPSTGAPK